MLKKVAWLFAAMTVALFGASSGAHAQQDDDNYLDPSVSVLDDGKVFTNDCIPGELVIFEFQGQTIEVTCDANGMAMAQFPALVCPPDATGPVTFSGTAVFTGQGDIDPEIDTSNRPLTRTFSATLNCGTIPAAGSSGTGPLLLTAGLVLAAGFAMLVVSQMRRRHAVA